MSVWAKILSGKTTDVSTDDRVGAAALLMVKGRAANSRNASCQTRKKASTSEMRQYVVIRPASLSPDSVTPLTAPTPQKSRAAFGGPPPAQNPWVYAATHPHPHDDADRYW